MWDTHAHIYIVYVCMFIAISMGTKSEGNIKIYHSMLHFNHGINGEKASFVGELGPTCEIVACSE